MAKFIRILGFTLGLFPRRERNFTVTTNPRTVNIELHTEDGQKVTFKSAEYWTDGSRIWIEIDNKTIHSYESKFITYFKAELEVKNDNH